MTTVSNRPISQPLLLAWCTWLLANLLLYLLPYPTVMTTQWFLQTVMIGLVLIWPTWRLSQDHSDAGEWHVLSNWLCLVLVLQVTVWPMRYLLDHPAQPNVSDMAWSIQRTALIVLTFVTWSWLVAACVRIGVRVGTHGARSGALVAIVLLLVAGPLIAIWTRRADLWDVSPFPVLWRLADAARPYNVWVELSRSAGVAVLGIAIWMRGNRPAQTGQHPDATL